MRNKGFFLYINIKIICYPPSYTHFVEKINEINLILLCVDRKKMSMCKKIKILLDYEEVIEYNSHDVFKYR